MSKTNWGRHAHDELMNIWDKLDGLLADLKDCEDCSTELIAKIYNVQVRVSEIGWCKEIVDAANEKG